MLCVSRPLGGAGLFGSGGANKSFGFGQTAFGEQKASGTFSARAGRGGPHWMDDELAVYVPPLRLVVREHRRRPGLGPRHLPGGPGRPRRLLPAGGRRYTGCPQALVLSCDFFCLFLLFFFLK